MVSLVLNGGGGGEELISDLPLEVQNTLPDGVGKIKLGHTTGPEAKMFPPWVFRKRIKGV